MICASTLVTETELLICDLPLLDAVTTISSRPAVSSSAAGVAADEAASCANAGVPLMAIKAAIALDGAGGPDMKPEIESRVGRLFRWHIDSAPQGMWIDLIDERGRSKAKDVPASIFYHLVCALTAYLAAKAK